jgi:serine carboxypeptidase-like clade 2
MGAGPGCSSIAYGFAEELGPFFVNPGGKTLRLNPNAGNKRKFIFLITSRMKIFQRVDNV